jgi:hypothetical protein
LLQHRYNIIRWQLINGEYSDANVYTPLFRAHINNQEVLAAYKINAEVLRGNVCGVRIQ